MVLNVETRQTIICRCLTSLVPYENRFLRSVTLMTDKYVTFFELSLGEAVRYNMLRHWQQTNYSPVSTYFCGFHASLATKGSG